jgi:hypothetical protein
MHRQSCQSVTLPTTMKPSIINSSNKCHSPLKIFDTKMKKDEFIHACAPMVRYSKVSGASGPVFEDMTETMPTSSQLAFRQTVHKYGVDICWTPMILAKEFNRNSFARDSGMLPGGIRGCVS